MGKVYLAIDSLIDRRVAVKVINAQLLSEEDRAAFLERFRTEARTLASDHPRNPGFAQQVALAERNLEALGEFPLELEEHPQPLGPGEHGAADPGEHHERVTRDFEVDVLEIVLARAPHVNRVGARLWAGPCGPQLWFLAHGVRCNPRRRVRKCNPDGDTQAAAWRSEPACHAAVSVGYEIDVGPDVVADGGDENVA